MLEDSFPVWQKLYQIISGSNKHLIDGVLDQVIEICKINLPNTLLNYKVYTRESYEEYGKKNQSQSDLSNDMFNCIQKISRELDLDPTFASNVLGNYFVFAYYGKIDELKSIIRYESNSKLLVEQVWNFYTSDRMFMLKTLRFILEKVTDKSFIHYKEFNIFLKGIDLQKLWKNLLKTFEYLIKEITAEKSKMVENSLLIQWMGRNNREQIEVLLLMILVVDLIDLNGDELEDVIKLFMKHGFGRYPLFYGGAPSRTQDVIDIKNAEIGVALTIIHRYWQNSDKIIVKLSKEVESDLQNKTHGDNSCIYFVWGIFKVSTSNTDLDRYSNILDRILHKAFKDLSEAATSNIFQNCKPGDIFIEAIYRFFIALCNIVEDQRLIYEQEGVVKILCELYKRPYLHALDTLGGFFQIAFDMFPYMLNNFLNIVEAVILSEEYYAKILAQLQNCPTYCTEMPWPDRNNSDEMRSLEEEYLLPGSEKFIVPAGTLLEKCNCFGKDMIKYHYRYDFFKIIEQYVISLTSWAFNKGEYNKLIYRNVMRANKFLIYLVKHYRGNFQLDTLIRPLLQRLDCVPTYYSKGGLKNFDFFCLYFESRCALIIHQNVDFSAAFPILIRKMLFPVISDYKYASTDLERFQSSCDFSLYGFLKEEEGYSDHKLLLNYIECVTYILDKQKSYVKEFYGAVWYLLHVVFPSFKLWKYNDKEHFQQSKILNGCLRVFIKILQQDPNDHQLLEQKALYKLIHDSFLNDPYIIEAFTKVFVRDKYLPSLMHQESNWIAGDTLIVVDAVKSEFALLLLIFKCRVKLPNAKCEIDKKAHIFAKTTSIYFVTPYNCTLEFLAGRFLEIFARNSEISLMSCLNLDYDQIQTLFLQRLRDPLEDETVKVTIVDLISTCIFHQHGMTAAFFNVQSTKKWYNPHAKIIEGEAVSDFIMDYLRNVRKSVEYLTSPLQVGMLKLMANLWQCQKQHLIKDVTKSNDFWSLIAYPLFTNFELDPTVYACIFKILSIQCAVSKMTKDDEFFQIITKFLSDQKQLRLFQQYIFKIFSNQELQPHYVNERVPLIKSWTELLIVVQKHTKEAYFPTSESQYLFIELVFDGILNEVIHSNILGVWLDLTLIVVDMFGLKFEQRVDELACKVIQYIKIIQKYYKDLSLKEKMIVLTIIVKNLKGLKSYYETHSAELLQLLEELAPLIDDEYYILVDVVYAKLKANEVTAKEQLGPWSLIIVLTNSLLTFENCEDLKIWFGNREYLDKTIHCLCELLRHKISWPCAKMSLLSLNLYMESPLALDFFKMDMVNCFDKLEPVVKSLLFLPLNKTNISDLQEGWCIFHLIIKFNILFVRKFQNQALNTCYSFLSLYESIINHVINIPEYSVDLKALDLLSQLLIYYLEILTYWKTEWFITSKGSFNVMMNGTRKTINACINLCLNPNRIKFYHFDSSYQSVSLHRDEQATNQLVVSVMNRLIGILGLGLYCLYHLNSKLLDLFDDFQPLFMKILIECDFSVPKFELPISSDLTYGKLFCLAHFLFKTMHQQKKRTSSEADVKKFASVTGVVEYQDTSVYMSNQKLGSFLSYIYEYSGLTDPWIKNLNSNNVEKTSGTLMLFIAQQVFLTKKNLEPDQVRQFNKTFHSELQFFNDFVRKHTSELMTRSSVSGHMGDMDYLDRYLVDQWQKNSREKALSNVSENNFLLLIYYWFTNICEI
ncbi:unnamed protein product [Ceutorhynchus assimilis]|uniref:Uncharacterized protein n=1 Tax=Ceutorhynchus assimilis TaxID=467358 RepID=A0A9N9QHX8_9CUCU|nr:unnamed protein product [Ceutorhynchus assimilis]